MTEPRHNPERSRYQIEIDGRIAGLPRAIPLCRFLASYVARHEQDYGDLVVHA